MSLPGFTPSSPFIAAAYPAGARRVLSKRGGSGVLTVNVDEAFELGVLGDPQTLLHTQAVATKGAS